MGRKLTGEVFLVPDYTPAYSLRTIVYAIHCSLSHLILIRIHEVLEHASHCCDYDHMRPKTFKISSSK